MLLMAWQASIAADNDNIWWSSSDGFTWSPPELLTDRQSSTSPTLAVDFNGVSMAWTASITAANDNIWWSSFDGNVWSPPEALVDGRSSTSPALGSS